MLNKNLQAVILAAGQAKRFKTGKNKLFATLCGRPLALHITTMLESLNIETALIVGYQKEELTELIQENHDGVQFFTQEQQLGTGHALACSRSGWTKNNILVLNGDMPLVSAALIERLCTEHEQTNAAISFVAAYFEETKHGYGRVITQNGTTHIVEAKDFKGDVETNRMINAGIYLIDTAFLKANIDNLAQNNVQKEFYITDLVGMASEQNRVVTTVAAPFDEVRGINTIEELWDAERVKQTELIKFWMSQGVRFMKPDTVCLDIMATIGAGTQIGAGAHILGSTVLGKNSTIGEYTRIENVSVGDNTIVRSHCIISDSILQDNVIIEPFVHIHDTSVIENNTHIETFADIQNAKINQEQIDAQEHEHSGGCCGSDDAHTHEHSL